MASNAISDRARARRGFDRARHRSCAARQHGAPGDGRVVADALVRCRRQTSQLDDASNRVLLSAAVVWEVAIKRFLGKLQAPAGFTATLLGAGASRTCSDPDMQQGVEQSALRHQGEELRWSVAVPPPWRSPGIERPDESSTRAPDPRVRFGGAGPPRRYSGKTSSAKPSVGLEPTTP